MPFCMVFSNIFCIVCVKSDFFPFVNIHKASTYYTHSFHSPYSHFLTTVIKMESITKGGKMIYSLQRKETRWQLFKAFRSRYFFVWPRISSWKNKFNSHYYSSSIEFFCYFVRIIQWVFNYNCMQSGETTNMLFLH